MLTFLQDIAEVILNIPQYILYALETLFNIFTEAIAALFAIATTLIPLPAEPSAPEYIENINWFFPIGPIITVATPVVIGFGSFLAIRWIYAKVGDL